MASAKPAFIDIYMNLVKHVEMLTDKLQQDLELRLKRLNTKPTAQPTAPPVKVEPEPIDPASTQPQNNVPPPVSPPSGDKTGSVNGADVPTSAVTKSGKPWWTKLPAWRGIRGVFRWLWYGHHRDNPDYAPYVKDWVDSFSRDRLKLSEYAAMQDRSLEIAEEFTNTLCTEFIEASLNDLPDLKNLIDQFKSDVRKAVYAAIKQTYELGKNSGGSASPVVNNPADPARKSDMGGDADDAGGDVGGLRPKPKSVVPTKVDEPSAETGDDKLQPTLSSQTDEELPTPPKRRRKKKIEPPVGDGTGEVTPELNPSVEPAGDEVGREVPEPESAVTPTDADSAEVVYGTKKVSPEELEGLKLNWDQRGEMLKTIESKMSGSKKTPMQQRRHKEWKDGKAGKEKAYQYLKSKSLIPDAPDDLKNIGGNARLRNYIQSIFHVTPKAAEGLMAFIKTRDKKSDLPIGGQTARSEQEVDAEVDDMLNKLGEHAVWSEFNRKLYEEMSADEKKDYLLSLMKKGKQDTFLPRMKVNLMPWNEKVAFYKNLLRA